MTRRRVLYLTYDGLTDPLGQSQILPYLAGVSKQGHSITLLSCEKTNAFEKLRDDVRRQCNDASIAWHPLVYHKTPPIVSTLYDLWNLWRLARTLHASDHFDIVHCRSYITAFVGLWMKRKYGTKFVFDMRGFWADERVEGGLWKQSNFLYRLVYRYFKKKELEFLQTSDHVISLTKNGLEQIRKWSVTTPATIIPCCVDVAHFDPEKVTIEAQTKARGGLGLDKDSFCVLYLGSWGTWYLTEEVLNFFSTLKERKPTAKLLIATRDRVRLENYRYKGDVIVQAIARKDVPVYISLASLALVLIKPSFSKKASSATKLGECLAMNIPVISNKGWGDIDEIARQAPIFFIDSINWGRIDEIKNVKSREYCLAELSLERGVDLYTRVYEQLYSMFMLQNGYRVDLI